LKLPAVFVIATVPAIAPITGARIETRQAKS